jgi:glycosyltransferase involved in cell wall biosynthesis
MIQKAIAQFARSDRCESVHLPFFFTSDIKTARRGSLRKGLELIRVIGRLFRIRLAGRIDVLLYPTGGPQRVPRIRDVLLLPWVFMVSHRVILHFHAAGIADELAKKPNSLLTRLISFVYRRAFAAVVMTEFNRRDPEAIGIKRILVVSYRVDDIFDPCYAGRADRHTIRLLNVGHLCSDKGTPQLLEAFADLRHSHPELELELVGECLPPFDHELLDQLLDRLQIRDHVHLSGILTGRAKAEAFGRADLFVFPSVAPYESFGLVLAEAMAWKLPIVASKWRGNFDVLTARAGAICFPVSSSLTDDIAIALRQALQQRSKWTEWGRVNRSIFDERYREDEATEWLVESVLSLIAAGL